MFYQTIHEWHPLAVHDDDACRSATVYGRWQRAANCARPMAGGTILVHYAYHDLATYVDDCAPSLALT